MHGLDLRSRSFDVVVNQETLCCANDRRQALSEVYRVLAPGGVWRAVDFSIAPKSLEPEAHARYGRVLTGFHMTSMTTTKEIREILGSVGFVRPRVRDLSRRVLPTALQIIASARRPVGLSTRFPDRQLFSTHPRRERNLRGHFDAGLAYSVGLLNGEFRYVYYSAERPRSREPRSRSRA
jgi:SAM-dependent methyltransferase